MSKKWKLTHVKMYIFLLSAMAASARSGPQGEQPSLAEMRSLPSTLRGTGYPELTSHRPGANTMAGPNQPAKGTAFPGRDEYRSSPQSRPTSVDNLHVKVYERVPNIPGGKLADAVGRPHQWIIVEDNLGNTVHAPGLGNKRGVPGAGGQSSPDWPFTNTFITNHAHQTPRTFRRFPAVDPECVIADTPYERYEGRWVPYINDCNNFVDRTIQACQLPNLRGSSLTKSETTKALERLGLFPAQETPLRYGLGVDLDVAESLNGNRGTFVPLPRPGARPGRPARTETQRTDKHPLK